jgi:hypothetical protein
MELIDAGCDLTQLGREYAGDLSTATHYRLGAQELEIETDDSGTLVFAPLPAHVVVRPIPTATPVPTIPPDWTLFEVGGLRLEINGQGEVVGIIDTATNTNHVQLRGPNIPFPFVAALSANRSLYPVRLTAQGFDLAFQLDSDTGLVVHVNAEYSGQALILELKDVPGPPVDKLRLQLPMDLKRVLAVGANGKGLGDESFGVYVLPLDDQTTVHAEAGAEGGVLSVEVASPAQLEGARIAIFAGSLDRASNIARSLTAPQPTPLPTPSTITSPDGLARCSTFTPILKGLI